MSDYETKLPKEYFILEYKTLIHPNINKVEQGLKDNDFKFPEGIIYEDYASIPTLVKYINNVYYLNKAFLHYVQTPTSTMRNIKYQKKYEDIFKATDILYTELSKTCYNEELEHLIIYK